MSPEQLEGRPIDARADLFAAGVVLYQLLTGMSPFDGDTDFAVIQKIVNHTPAAATFFNARLPSAIDAVVAKSLAKSRDMRYATAEDFAAALQAACRQATDISIAPTGIVPGKGSNSTWTATMMPGESLVATESGVRTSSGISSGTGASLVTQEVELVYWKDIKDSTDLEDLQGFLAKFPSGIYADLARRRLKNLGVPSGKDTDASVTRLTTAPLDSGMDKTLVVPRMPDVDKSAVANADIDVDALPVVAEAAVAIAPTPEVATQFMATPEAAASITQPKRKTMLIWVGVAMLAVAGVAAKLMSGSGSPAVQVAGPQLTASAPALPASSASSAGSSLVGAAPVPAASRPVAAAITSTINVPKPATAASKTAVVTPKKASPEKDRPIKEEPVKAPVPGAPAADKAVATAANPRTACEDRMLLGFQSCMAEQCARPVFTNHPICAERRAMDERRREAERNR